MANTPFKFTFDIRSVTLQRPLSLWERRYFINENGEVTVQEGELLGDYFMIHSVFELRFEIAEDEINRLLGHRWISVFHV